MACACLEIVRKRLAVSGEGKKAVLIAQPIVACHNLNAVTQNCFDDALDRILIGAERPLVVRVYSNSPAARKAIKSQAKWRNARIVLPLFGTPCPSASRLRLTLLLPRLVGLGPDFFPAQRSFGHRSIQTEPIPVDAAQLIKLFDARLPA